MEINDILIRAFNANDMEAVLALWESCGLIEPGHDPEIDIKRKMAHDPERFLVADAGGRVIGTCMAGYDGLRGWIYYLGVDPDFRKQGIARRMLTHAALSLEQAGCPSINLMVKHRNRDVVSFYKKSGYEEDDVTVMSSPLHDRGSCPS